MLAAAALLLFAAERFDAPPNLAHHRLLVASPEMKDERFRETVILMLRQSKPGSIGLVLNKPAADSDYFIGGPMEPENRIFVLHTLDQALPGTLEINDLGLGLLEGEAAVQALQQAERKPRWHIVVKGYAGWGKRQLTRELDGGGWRVIAYDEKLITRTPPEKMWENAMQLPVLHDE
jgi:putative transcriptional regulator